MTTETAGELRFSAGLGPMPEDALRQQAFLILSRLQSGTEDVVCLDAALAAVAAERERCSDIVAEAQVYPTDVDCKALNPVLQAIMKAIERPNDSISGHQRPATERKP